MGEELFAVLVLFFGGVGFVELDEVGLEGVREAGEEGK